MCIHTPVWVVYYRINRAVFMDDEPIKTGHAVIPFGHPQLPAVVADDELLTIRQLQRQSGARRWMRPTGLRFSTVPSRIKGPNGVLARPYAT